MISLRLMLILFLTSLMIVCGVLEYMVVLNVHSSLTHSQSRDWIMDVQGGSLEEKNAVWRKLAYAAIKKRMAGHSDLVEEEVEESIKKKLAWLDWLRASGRINSNAGRVGKVEDSARDDDEDDGIVSAVADSDESSEVLVENNKSLRRRTLTPEESKGNHIMLTLRTMKKLHSKRLPLLFATWLTKVNRKNVFVVTDEKDSVWQRRVWKNDMHYVVSGCSNHESREDRLCCRTGTELAQIFKKGYEHYDWLCHIDDDMYVHMPPLVKLLSPFNGRKDAVYLGRAGSGWDTPRRVKEGSRIGTAGRGYHFAVGGMYCLSRAMLEMARPYLIGGRNLTRSCAKAMEPDDVTIGLIVGVVLNKTLSRTEKIYTHGLHLVSTVDPETLAEQVAFSYGFGSSHWGYDDYNAIYVPNALYSLEDDVSQFRSLHCYLYPQEPQCVTRSKDLLNVFNNDVFRL